MSARMSAGAYGIDERESEFFQEKYQYVEQEQKYHVVIPCLELKEFKDCHARRIHGLGITTEALIEFGYKHNCWNWPTCKVMRVVTLSFLVLLDLMQ